MTQDPKPADPKRAIRREDRRRTRRTLGILGLLLGLIFAGAVGTVGWVLYSAQMAINKSTNSKGGSVIDVFIPPAPAAGASSRTTVLIAGNSYDDPGHPGADLTDSIMLGTVDTTTSKAALVSIPRDLLVDYNGSKMKINAVYYAAGRGEAGLTALGQVAEQVTGMHVDKHVLIGVNAFKGVVDAVGGIDVDIQATDPRGIYEPNMDLLLPNGPQHLDGATALKLARARNIPVGGKTPYGLADSDFSRQQSQRMILAAVLSKVKSSSTLSNPLAIVNLFNAVADHMTTDLTVGEIRTLYGPATKGGTPLSITARGTNAAPLLTDFNGYGVGDALIPKAGMFDYSQIKAYVSAQVGL